MHWGVASIISARRAIFFETRAAEAVAVHVLPGGDGASTDLFAHGHALGRCVDHLGEKGHLLRNRCAVLLRLGARIGSAEERERRGGYNEEQDTHVCYVRLRKREAAS